ncbi:hypothetical protein Ahia01_000651100 [Argonauta hians]
MDPGRLKVGEVFPTWNEFYVLFKDYQAANNCIFTKKHVMSIAKYNETMKKECNKLPLDLCYKSIQLQCKHYGDYTSKSNGTRPNQLSFKQFCPSRVCLRANKGVGLVITVAELRHNHKMIENRKDAALFPELRKLSKEQETEVDGMLACKIKPSKIVEVMALRHGTILKVYDIYNRKRYKNNSKTAEETMNTMVVGQNSEDINTTINQLDSNMIITDQKTMNTMVFDQNSEDINTTINQLDSNMIITDQKTMNTMVFGQNSEDINTTINQQDTNITITDQETMNTMVFGQNSEDINTTIIGDKSINQMDSNMIISDQECQSKTLNKSEKLEKCRDLLNEIAEVISEKEEDEFNKNLSLLRGICDLMKNVPVLEAPAGIPPEPPISGVTDFKRNLLRDQEDTKTVSLFQTPVEMSMEPQTNGHTDFHCSLLDQPGFETVADCPPAVAMVKVEACSDESLDEAPQEKWKKLSNKEEIAGITETFLASVLIDEGLVPIVMKRLFPVNEYMLKDISSIHKEDIPYFCSEYFTASCWNFITVS